MGEVCLSLSAAAAIKRTRVLALRRVSDAGVYAGLKEHTLCARLTHCAHAARSPSGSFSCATVAIVVGMEGAMNTTIHAWATTDVGRRRDHNEDRYLIAHDLGLYAVADGMGGAASGEVASSMAVQTIDRRVRERCGRGDPGVTLRDAVVDANGAIYRRAQDDRYSKGMGTTTTSILFRGGEAVVAHVGDSRVYLIRHGHIHQISEDHSLVNMQLKAGVITEAQAKTSPFKNVITRAVGVTEKVEVDVFHLGLEDGDTFILCSDGLSGVVTDDEILRCVQENFLHRVVGVLVDLANDRGGPDNITVVCCHVVSTPDMSVDR